MAKYTKKDVIRLVEEEDVEFIRLQFTDLFGSLKNVAITASQLERALNNRCSFDGSSIPGFVKIEESDLYLYPDLDTLEIFPWRPQQGKVARLICDVHSPDGQPFVGDPRYVLRQVIAEAQAMGYRFQVGPECEFSLFLCNDEGQPTTVTHELGGYFDVAPLDLAENVRRDIILNLEDMGFHVEASHHEVAPGQHEITVHYGDGLEVADQIQTYRMTVKTIAKRHGMHATFMPKPKADANGNGMHLNMSLADMDGNNVFTDEADANGLSPVAYQFIAGVMAHAKGLACITNPLVNSYKRLVSGFEAPTSIAWAPLNRSALIRVPAPVGRHRRIELRCPDGASNPYLALALCLAAGLDGIKKGMTPPKEVRQNLFRMTQAEKLERGIESLPETLGEAITAFEQDTFLQDVMGEHLTEAYLTAKKQEWLAYLHQVSDWEIAQYLFKH